MSCPYTNMFGAPGTGAHSYRLFDLAIVDVVLTVLAAWITSYVSGLSIWLSLAIWFTAGIIFHRIFCVRSTVDKWLWPKT